MGTDTVPVMENAKLCRFHLKYDIFWIYVTTSDICRYVSSSVAGCCRFCVWAKVAYSHFNLPNKICHVPTNPAFNSISVKLWAITILDLNIGLAKSTLKSGHQ